MSFSQVGVGTTNPKGALDVVSTTQGFIMPRVADHTTLTVGADQTGMQVYNTTTNSVWTYDGTAWLSPAAAAGAKFVDGTTAADAVFSGGSVGIGTAAPDASSALDITSTTQGLLPPRMTKVQMEAITAVEGLTVYCTNCFPK